LWKDFARKPLSAEIIVGTIENQSNNISSSPQRGAALLPLDRFIAFSDGVFAIAITVLVLELVVPTYSAPLLPALLELWPDFLGYLISFSFIGGIWISHSSLTSLMKRGDTIAYGLDLLMLLFVALLPFSTEVMVTHITQPDVSIAVVIYGLNLLIASLMLSLLMFYIARQPRLVSDEIADVQIKGIIRQRWIAIGLSTFAVILAFVVPQMAVALYLIVTILFLILPFLGIVRHRHKPA
jgi:uncharacterized membrane protein